jgi:lipid II:glycine glycyltransferase (peptidoglycan interpeptide bridge formation enzyme)
MNYVLNLNNSYEYLYATYRENIQRNIKKSTQFQLHIHKNMAIADVIKLAKEQAGSFAAIADDDFNRFEKLFQLLYHKQKATTYGVYTKEGALIASAVFFFSHHRAYYIMAGNHPNGKTLGASHALINAFIKDHAGEDLLLDFEGSDIPSLAFFYSSFGAVEEKYSAIKLNRLPAPIKWLKK